MSRTDRALCVVVVVAAAFYEWTARTSVTGPSHSYYYLLAQSFLHLHTYLPLKVPAGLAALSNPYDPTTNFLYADRSPGFHDLAYFHGHFYSAWGPTPALVLYLPARLIGIEVTDANAVPIFATIALIFAVLLLRALVRRWVPAARGWAVVLGACALAFGTAIPFVLRRPDIYEVAICAGAAFMMAGLYLAQRAMFGAPAPSWRPMAAASICIGLAFAARPPLILGGALLAVAAVALARRRGLPRRDRRRFVLALLGPLVVCVLAIAAYNQERFGSPTQFGVNYQLASVDQTQKAAFQVTYATPGIYYYAFAPPRIALAFPHVFLPPPPGYPGTLPVGYAGAQQRDAATDVPVEPTGGIIPTAPIVLFIGAALLFWRRRAVGGRSLALAIAALALLGTAILVGLAVSLWGTTERYEVDFDLLLILAGALGWIGLIGALRGRRRRRAVTVAGAAAVAWTCIVGVAVSVTGYYDALARLHPGVFNTLEDLTSPLATAATMLAGRPVIARVASPTPVTYANVGYTSFGNGDSSTTLGLGAVTIVVVSPGSQRTWLRTLVVPGAFIAPSTPIKIVLRESGRRATRIPVRYGYTYIPLHLAWGLNRIGLDVWKGNPQGLTIQVEEMTLVSKLPARGPRRAARQNAQHTESG